MRRSLHIGILFLAALILGACDFRPMAEFSNTHYVRIYLDEHLLNVTEGYYNPDYLHPEYKRPEIVRCALFDPESGDLVAERYLRNQGDDEHGHYYDGYIICEPGSYNLVAYNFGTESTVVSGEYNCYDMRAYTNEISPLLSSKLKSRQRAQDGETSDAGDGSDTKAGESIRYDADHLFVVSEPDVRIGNRAGIDTLTSANGQKWFQAESIVKSYYLQIGIKGIEYISSSVSLQTGMAGSAWTFSGTYQDGDEATLYFDMNNGALPGVSDYACIYTTFGTFGKLPDAENKLEITFEFITTYGAHYDVTLDITQDFYTEDAVKHQWIIIDKVIEIPEPPEPDQPEGGGLAPSVNEWNDVYSDIDI